MSSITKYGLTLLGGVAAGVLGVVALSKGKADLKPVAVDLLSRGMDVTDTLLGKIESVKEDFEDIAASARQLSDKRKVNKS